MNSEQGGTDQLVDAEIVQLVEERHLSRHQLETKLGDASRGVRVRRKIYGKNAQLRRAMEKLPYQHYDYEKVMGACCENVVGYMPVPVGVVGPLNLDGRRVQVPMATTEGCLVASTNRGCSALRGCGVTTAVTYDGMTRGPVVRFPCMIRATDALRWIENKNNFESIKAHFDSTSRFARLMRIHTRVAGRQLYIRFVKIQFSTNTKIQRTQLTFWSRFVARSGDAMGMNMLSKATEFAINRLLDVFPDMEILSLSGNFCTDKKPAAVNWVYTITNTNTNTN
jgi:hydroxymethylglutaryl-CoA reductase (NADPH)